MKCCKNCRWLKWVTTTDTFYYCSFDGVELSGDLSYCCPAWESSGAKMDDKDINVPCKTKRERNRCLSLSSLQKQNEEMQEVANKDAFYGEALND